MKMQPDFHPATRFWECPSTFQSKTTKSKEARSIIPEAREDGSCKSQRAG